MKQKSNDEIIFVSRDYPKGIQKIMDNGYKVEKIPTNKINEEIGVFNGILEKIKPNAVVIDMFDTDSGYIKNIKNKVPAVVSIDDRSEGRNDADVLIYALKDGPNEYREGQPVFDGPKYMCIDDVFAEFAQKNKIIKKECKSLLITYGGTDPEMLTIKTLKAIGTINKKFDITVVLGIAFLYKKELEEVIDEMGIDLKIKSNITPREHAKLMFDSDIAFFSGGLTQYELAAVGVPGIQIWQNVEPQSKEAFNKYDTSVKLGLAKDVTEEQIKFTLEELEKNYERRKKLSNTGKSLVDGRGSERVADIILNVMR